MKAIRSAAAALSVVAALAPVSARAYPIDCAILLCLAGGWPASAECAAARVVFIRRITPWPVEPPLQIWRCPMRASAETEPELDRLFTIAKREDQLAEFRKTMRALAERIAQAPEGADVELRKASDSTGTYSTENGRADIDISSPEFDFVRSIRVFDVDWYRRTSHDRCSNLKWRVRTGTYGSQGEFTWAASDISSLPKFMHQGLTSSNNCEYLGALRAIGIEWRDFAGNYSYELVTY